MNAVPAFQDFHKQEPRRMTLEESEELRSIEAQTEALRARLDKRQEHIDDWIRSRKKVGREWLIIAVFFAAQFAFWHFIALFERFYDWLSKEWHSLIGLALFGAAALGAKYLKRRYLGPYGAIERMLALFVAGIAFGTTQSAAAKTCALLGALYFYVRGDDNYDEGNKEHVALESAIRACREESPEITKISDEISARLKNLRARLESRVDSGAPRESSTPRRRSRSIEANPHPRDGDQSPLRSPPRAGLG